jgi:hypothetical protein
MLLGRISFLLLKTAFCDTCQGLQVNISLCLQLVSSSSYLSICNIGLGAFSKLLEVTICFFMSVRPSVCKKQFGFQFGNFYEIQYLKIFPISVNINQFLVKYYNNKDTLL